MQRKYAKDRRNDLIDLMMDAIKNENQGANEDEDNLDQFEKDAKLIGHRVKKGALKEENVIATAMVMLVAGYDTTGLTLSWAAFELARNQDVQKNLQVSLYIK